MRLLSRLLVLLVVIGLLTAPILAAPIAVRSGLTSAPAPPVESPTGRALLAVVSLGLTALGITIRKDTGSLANKYVTRATAAAGDYKDGVANAGGDWETATKNAEPNFEQGVQQAIVDKRFGRGVSGAGSKYQVNAVTLGSQRYGPGVQNAKDAWSRGVQPVIDTLKSLTLPPKGPRRSPQNMQRANAVATALGALKTGK